jgi:ABC-type sugar transport system ATPase subunit
MSFTNGAAPPIIELRSIHKKFPGVHALKGVSFDLRPGEVHALVGENGAGKSTVIKVMAGVYDFEGSYLFDGKEARIAEPLDAIRLGISVIYQELNLVQDLSIAENIFFGKLPTTRTGRVKWSEVYARTEEHLGEVGLRVSARTKVRRLSVARQQLVEIARSLSLNAKVIIMDEPTSALCPSEIENLFSLVARLKGKGVGIVYVSHKLDEIFAIADRVTVLRDGAYVGTEDIADLTNRKLISMMVGRELSSLLPKTAPVLGEDILDVKDLSTDKVSKVSCHVRRGEIVGFAGLMGAGRTELARALIGLDRRIEGSVVLDGSKLAKDDPPLACRIGFGLVPEDRKLEGIFPDLDIRQNMSIVSLGDLRAGLGISASREKTVVDDMIRRLGIRTPSSSQLVAKLSGGNQQKVILARWLIKKNVKVLIIDEPTRGIDVGAKAEIYRIIDGLAHQGMAIVMMSSEMQELIGMCDRIYVMAGGRIVDEISGADATQERILSSCIDERG